MYKFLVLSISVFLTSCAGYYRNNLVEVVERDEFEFTEPVVTEQKLGIGVYHKITFLPGKYVASVENENGVYYACEDYCVHYKGESGPAIAHKGGIWLGNDKKKKPEFAFYLFGLQKFVGEEYDKEKYEEGVKKLNYQAGGAVGGLIGNAIMKSEYGKINILLRLPENFYEDHIEGKIKPHEVDK